MKILLVYALVLFIIGYIYLNLVKNDTLIRIKGIKNKLKDKFNISISESSIRNILQKNGITFKKIYKQINPYTEKELKNNKKY
jgi:transposase